MNLRDLVNNYRAAGKSYAELVPWFEQITPGLIINLDGSLLAAFEYDGIDYDSTNDDDHDAASESLETAFGAFDDRNILWSFTDKRRRIFIDAAEIGHPVARFVEEEWLKAVDNGSLASFRHVIFVAYRPFKGAGGIFDEVGALMSDGHSSLPSALAEVARQAVLMKSGIEKVDGKIISAIASFESQLSSFGQVLPRLKFRRIDGNPLLAELSNRINPASPRTQVSVPSEGPVYLNTLLTTDTLRRTDGGVLRFDGGTGSRLMTMLSLKGYPGKVRNDYVEQLLMIPGDFSLVQMYRFLDREAAKSFVMRSEQHYRSQVKGPVIEMVEKLTGTDSGRVDMGQFVLAEDSQAALIEITAHNVNFGYHTMAVQVIGYDAEDLSMTRKTLAGVLSNAGYGVVNEVIHQIGAYCACIPGVADGGVRATMVSTRNLADMSMVRSIQPGATKNHYLTEQRKVDSPSLCLFPTPSGVPELFNFHVGDVGHFMVIGPNGAGKTSLINLLIMQWQRYAPCRVIVLDKDNSCALTIKALGGSYIRLTNDGGEVSRMNPLRWMSDPKRWGDIARWLMGAMEAFGGAPITERQAQSLNTTIALIGGNADVAQWNLSTFKAMLDGQDSDFSARLGPWVRSSHGASANYGHIFDNVSDGFADQLRKDANGIVGIDVGGLLKDDRLAPSVLEYLFMAIDDLVDGRTPTLIYLEEGWYLLGNERFRMGFEEWIKTMRKRLAAVGLSTQSVDDIARSGISSTLNDNIKTRIFLPNSQALASRDVYTNLLGLSLDHVQLIRSLIPKRHYMVWQEGRTRVLDCHMPPSVLALTRSDGLARDTFNRWLATGRADYIDQYVKEMTHAR